MNSWREQSEALFFIEHLAIKDIAQIINRSRETVSRHLNDCEQYEAEMEFRRIKSENERRNYYREHKREIRGYYSDPNADDLKQDHETAVKILSRDVYDMFSG